MRTIDLHAHTTASDGSLTPTELIDLAVQTGLTAIAVTDHDTIDGLAEAEEAARRRNIEFVPGVELAVEYPHGKFHMLGYLIDYRHPALSGRLQQVKDNRARRNVLMVAKMQALGLPVTLEDIEAEAGGGQVGRPHMALVLLKKGLVSSTQEAFDRYLADGALAHLPKDKITVEEGLNLIHAAGGLAVAAHPDSFKLDDATLAKEMARLRAIGLDGMECYYSQYAPERTASYLAIAREAGLLVTGGSDFHGASKPHVKLGCVEGDRPAPNALLEALKEHKSMRSGVQALGVQDGPPEHLNT